MIFDGEEIYDAHGGPWYTYHTDLYYGAIREDLGKIYFVMPDSTKPLTLYDFHLTIGDTVSTLIGKGLVITSIDTLTNGRKTFLTNDPETYFIEGIGSNKGLFNLEHSFWFLEYFYLKKQMLGCYHQSDSLVYMLNESVCNYDISVDIPETSHPSINIFPNPTETELRINTEIPIESFRVYDAFGKQHELKLDGSGLVNISFLRKGIYILVINEDQRLKFI